MDMFYIPAIASFSGSASGTLASIVTSTRISLKRHRGCTPTPSSKRYRD
jgi:hypothetical protein